MMQSRENSSKLAIDCFEAYEFNFSSEPEFVSLNAANESLFNLILSVCQNMDLGYLILSWLDQMALVNLAGAILGSKECHQVGLFRVCKAAYLKETRLERAQTLRDHVMCWRYDQAKDLVKLDPEVLGVRCNYKANRWLPDAREYFLPLTGLEYTWMFGDMKFKKLFEEAGRGHLKPICYKNKETLEKIHQSDYHNYKDLPLYAVQNHRDRSLKDLLLACYGAPTWFLGFICHIYRYKVATIETLDNVDVSSDDFLGSVNSLSTILQFRLPGSVNGIRPQRQRRV